jgi:hypothetical protein
MALQVVRIFFLHYTNTMIWSFKKLKLFSPTRESDSSLGRDIMQEQLLWSALPNFLQTHFQHVFMVFETVHKEMPM